MLAVAGKNKLAVVKLHNKPRKLTEKKTIYCEYDKLWIDILKIIKNTDPLKSAGNTIR